MRSICVTVPKAEAEAVRQRLLAMGLLRKDARVEREGDTVFLPVTAPAAVGHPTVEREVREAYVPVRSYKDLAKVPPDLKASLPTSFDVVGDVAIVKIPEELGPFERAIADAILAAHANVAVVAADAGVKGALRVRDLRVLAGPKRTETVHLEYGLSYAVDVAKAYFSPRLGSERMRVAAQVRPGEVVVDMFAGVGPYAVLIARRREPRVVYAFDANPDAFRYLEENVRRNRAERVVARLGDAQELLAAVEPPDRIVVDYPHGPEEAYRAALARVQSGGVVHHYEILESAEREARAESLVAAAEAAGRTAEVLEQTEVHGWSPTRALFAFDLKIG